MVSWSLRAHVPRRQRHCPDWACSYGQWQSLCPSSSIRLHPDDSPSDASTSIDCRNALSTRSPASHSLRSAWRVAFASVPILGRSPRQRTRNEISLCRFRRTQSTLLSPGEEILAPNRYMLRSSVQYRIIASLIRFRQCDGTVLVVGSSEFFWIRQEVQRRIIRIWIDNRSQYLDPRSRPELLTRSVSPDPGAIPRRRNQANSRRSG